MKTLLIEIITTKTQEEKGYDSLQELIENETVFKKGDDINIEYLRDASYDIGFFDHQLRYVKNYIANLDDATTVMVTYGPVQHKTTDSTINVIDQMHG
jgi:hypothetical protein